MHRVLVIEGDRAIRDGLELSLRRQGHHLLVADSGEEGLARLRMDRPDVVVLDVMLPGIDGFEVCRRIRAVLRRSDREPTGRDAFGRGFEHRFGPL